MTAEGGRGSGRGMSLPESVYAEFGEVLADVVDDVFELAVELEGLSDEPVMGAGQGDRRLGATGEGEDVVRGDLDGDGLNAPPLLLDLEADGPLGGGGLRRTDGGLVFLFHVLVLGG